MLVLVKLCAEVALLALAGQWVLALLVGARREGNLMYGLLRVVSSPVVRLVDRWGPSGLTARGRGAMAAVLLCVLWLAATAGKVWMCLDVGVSSCR
ncbi:MAG: hypothetical protein Q8M88_01130 [Phenylobacterium sp.]|uniref:hypothetical protein n=1 Tax=Phenylobacterium sp. TaxID=1871053 RepID=UPI00273497D4|nr:hypothetical protein [Phenylobacterium sp.]MDP3173021.1 hypothetical protein [Phenylobacterium sp.]